MDTQTPDHQQPSTTSTATVSIPFLSAVVGRRACVISSFLVLLCFPILFDIRASFLISNDGLRRPTGSAAAPDDEGISVAGGGCDYSNGRWVWNESLLHGTYSEECRFLDPGFQCRRNGRRDVDYVKWRWQPHGCDLPRFDPSDMLERSRNARIVFAGDSIGRNHWESLVCMLASAVRNESSIYEQNGNPVTKHKGYLSIRFHDHNLTVEYYRVPFLVLVGRPPPNSPPQVKKALHVDRLDWLSEQWIGADVLIFNAGHWWNQNKILKMGCYFQEGDHINTTMDVREAFKRSLKTWKRWVLQSLHPQKSYVFFRSYSLAHVKGGVWDKGGRCDLNTALETNYMNVQDEPWSNQDISETIEQIRGEYRNVQFLNITYLTKFRRDGHPSIHREPGTPTPSPPDCSHWCLPGVPDTWNHILYAYLLSKHTIT